MKWLNRFIIIFIGMIFTVAAEASQPTSRYSNRYIGRLSYLGMQQNNGGSFSTSKIEFGFRYWLGTKAYFLSLAGIYPLQFDQGEYITGGSLSVCIGLNLDNVLHLEYGIDHHTWGNAIPGNTSFYGKVIFPTSWNYISEFFGGASFSGNSSGKTPSFIIQIGMSHLF